ncbi:MAG TPA: T9SS type A sorting domain-containing protein [Bacteroidia bacterium]
MRKNYMNKLLLPAALVLLYGSKLNAQCYSCGTGADGAYQALNNTTLAGGTYNFTSFTISPGVTVTVTGTQPLTIMCSGNVAINGTLDASGGNGTNGVTSSNAGTGGVGVAGGSNGGDGIYSNNTGPLDGQAGFGNGMGAYGSGWSGGGGAGFDTVGQSSGGVGGAGGPIYGDAQLTVVYGGSGGGGGSGGYSCGSGGGGAGGGVIVISSCGTITIGATGMVKTNGGNGGSDGTGNCGGGGGGSGGTIWMGASTITNNGSISSVGGAGGASAVPNNPYYGGGGNGSKGRIRLDYVTLLGTGTVTPATGYTSPLLSSTPSSTPDNGTGNGTATANASGGTSPYTYAWSPGGQTTSTATGLTTGNYTVVVTDANNCTVSATIVVGTSVGYASNVTSYEDLNVFPNPATDKVIVRGGAIVQQELNLQLLDITGKVIRNETLSANGRWVHEMSVSNLAEGIYFIRLTDGSGSKVKRIAVVR